MNNLNSILIEGRLAGDIAGGIVLDGAANESAACDFTLTSVQRRKTKTGEIEEETRVHVRAYGTLAEKAAKVGRKGNVLRVVGRLKEERRAPPGGKPQSRIIIIAEHVEFRPGWDVADGE
jgi:single-strand DNA-binding protein